MPAQTTPKASVIRSESGVLTLWQVKWPSTSSKDGKTYIATTYPGSDLVYIEMAANRRAVGGTVKMKIEPAVRAAIAAALA